MAFTLYEDGQMKIMSEKVLYETFYIKNKDSNDLSYDIPIRLFNDAFHIQRGQLENELNNVNPEIVKNLKKANINIDSAHLAICLAACHSWELIQSDRESERVSFLCE